MHVRRVRTMFMFSALAVALAGCPPTMEATREGGTACVSTATCNPAGVNCGEVHLCVQGFCSDTTTILACREGGYPDSGPAGNCATYEDCNPAPACGSVIPCINFVCDPGAPRLDIPCPDAGPDAARPDAAVDASDVFINPEGGAFDASFPD